MLQEFSRCVIMSQSAGSQEVVEPLWHARPLLENISAIDLLLMRVRKNEVLLAHYHTDRTFPISDSRVDLEWLLDRFRRT